MQSSGKRLQKRTAAGGARLIQINIINGRIMNLKALHVLAADINDKLHIRHKLLSCP